MSNNTQTPPPAKHRPRDKVGRIAILSEHHVFDLALPALAVFDHLPDVKEMVGFAGCQSLECGDLSPLSFWFIRLKRTSDLVQRSTGSSSLLPSRSNR